MADNVSVPSGSGALIAADEITHPTLGTVKVQLMKIADGTMDGTTGAVVTTTSPASNAGGLVTRPLLHGANGQPINGDSLTGGMLSLPAEKSTAASVAATAGTLSGTQTNGGFNTVGFVASGVAGGAAFGIDVSFDGSVWNQNAFFTNISGSVMTTASANGSYRVWIGGAVAYRFRCTTSGTGTINFAQQVASGTHATGLVDFGTGATARITTGSAALTDAALTVGLHPSVPLPGGTNTIGNVNISQLPGTGGIITAVSANGALTSPDNSTPTANSSVTLSIGNGYSPSAFSVNIPPTAVFSGNIYIDVSTTGTYFITIPVYNISTQTLVSSITTSGTYIFAGPYTSIRVRVGSGGTVTSGLVPLISSIFSAGATTISNALPVGDATIGRLKLTDGTTVAKVAAASTAPVATDPALVVSLSPNGSTVKVWDGTNTLSMKTVPTGGTGLTALPVYNNAIQAATYVSACRNIATAALSANVSKQVFSFEKTNAAKTVKIRRILMAGYQTTALAGMLDFQLFRGSAASTAGSGANVNGAPRVSTDGASVCTMKSLPTITAATLVDNIPGFVSPTTTATGFATTVLYDWQESGETKPWTLIAGSIDSLVISVISAAAQNWTLSCQIIYTEE
jgi:hypothetical protein